MIIADAIREAAQQAADQAGPPPEWLCDEVVRIVDDCQIPGWRPAV